MAAKRKTTAEKVAKLLGDNGQNWVAKDGRSLAQIAKENGCRTVAEAGAGVRYNFPDGSSIIDSEGGWDLGISLDCWCWAGAGHSEACNERRAEREDR